MIKEKKEKRQGDIDDKDRDGGGGDAVSVLPSLSYLSFHHIINSICYTTVAGLGREGRTPPE